MPAFFLSVLSTWFVVWTGSGSSRRSSPTDEGLRSKMENLISELPCVTYCTLPGCCLNMVEVGLYEKRSCMAETRLQYSRLTKVNVAQNCCLHLQSFHLNGPE
jgi:hypothetical protein